MTRSTDFFMPEHERDQFNLRTLMHVREKLKHIIEIHGYPENKPGVITFIADIDVAEDCMHYLNDCWDAF